MRADYLSLVTAEDSFSFIFRILPLVRRMNSSCDLMSFIFLANSLRVSDSDCLEVWVSDNSIFSMRAISTRVSYKLFEDIMLVMIYLQGHKTIDPIIYNKSTQSMTQTEFLASSSVSKLGHINEKVDDRHRLSITWKAIFGMLFISVAVVFLWSFHSEGYWNSAENQLLDQISAHPRLLEYETLQAQTINKIQSEYDDQKYYLQLSPKVRERISYGQPRPKQSFARMAIFTKKTKLSGDAVQCVITNGVTVISKKTIDTGLAILSNKQIYRWVLLLPNVDAIADGLINGVNDYDKKVIDIDFDADYNFLRENSVDCTAYYYLQNTFVINKEESAKMVAEGMKITSNLKQGFVAFSTVADIVGTNKQLKDLRNVDLTTFPEQSFNEYVYFFDAKFYSTVTPINFIHFTLYTAQQILINPLLVVTQGSNKLVQLPGFKYTFDEAPVQFKQFVIYPAKTQQKQTYLFVAYSTQPSTYSKSELEQYLKSFNQVDKLFYHTTLVVYLPYNQNQQSLYSAYELLRGIKTSDKLRIKLRIKEKKAVSSLSVYDAVFLYSAGSPIVISSRLNVILKKQSLKGSFLGDITAKISEKSHYFLPVTAEDTSLQKLFSKQDGRVNEARFLATLAPLQIFKADLFKMINLWMLKKDENQFFQTEAAFILPMIEMCDYKAEPVVDVYSVMQKREVGAEESNEIAFLKKYTKWDVIGDNKLQPIKYNSLVNLDLRRNALDQIPKIIHQVWFSEQPIPQYTKKLMETVKQTHKDFKYNLWTRRNFTSTEFPMTYTLVARAIEQEWVTKQSYHAWMQALIGYEALFNHGGIYLATNVEAVKSLKPFLKYEYFFSGFYSSEKTYGYPESFARDIIGVKRYGYHLRMILTEIINEMRVNFDLTDYEAMLGGDVLRVAMTNNQVFTTTAFGFYMLNYDPFRSEAVKCKEIPCNLYNESYVRIHEYI